MRKKGLCVFLSAIIIIMLTSCASKDEEKSISQVLGTDLSGGTILKSEDSHGGFHGDGGTYIQIQYDDEKNKRIIQAIDDTVAWSKLPLTENLNTLVYGKETVAASVGPYISDDDGKALFPEVQNGYYYFYDRNSKSKNAKDDSDVFNRSSYNLTIALYDMDARVLYYYEWDT